jgi:hypothetical protein
MNAEQVNTVGGWCELVGVVFLVRDLMSLVRFREKPKEWSARVKQWSARVRAWWAATPVMSWWRRLLGRQQPETIAKAGTANVSLAVHGVTQSQGTGKLTLRSGQSLQDQVEELRQRVNQLGEQIASEKQQREQAIAVEQKARREEVRAEANERERQIAEVQHDVEKLREVTTGDLGLRFESVGFLVAGIVLTAWPELIAEWLPDSLQFRVALAIVLGWPALRFWWLWKRSQQDEVLV